MVGRELDAKIRVDRSADRPGTVGLGAAAHPLQVQHQARREPGTIDPQLAAALDGGAAEPGQRHCFRIGDPLLHEQ